MAEGSTPVSFAPITEMLGAKLSDDKEHVLLGFKQADEGSEFVIGVPIPILFEIILELVRATEAVPAPKSLTVSALSMGANWYEFGQDDATGDFFLRFRLVTGGHLSFVFDRSMAIGLTESMNVKVLGGTVTVPADTKRN
jgi:hypothetical protein